MVEEEALRLPFVLDEALTHADEARFAEVAATLAQVAEEERRQVIYLSARERDAERFRASTGRPPRHIRLAPAPAEAPLTEDAIALPPRPEIPKPGSMTAAAYGAALGVPGIRLELGAGGIHVFHLLRDDLELLRRLLELGYGQIGPLSQLLAQPAGEMTVPDPARREELRTRIAAASLWLEQARRNRGRPVDRNALEQAEGVSATFLDRVAHLAETVGGDGRRLIEELRAGALARFREANINDLQTWLRDEGYIFSDPPLDMAGRARATYEAAAARGPEVAAAATTLTPWLERGAEAALDGAARPSGDGAAEERGPGALRGEAPA
jgi:hypothetical protein